MPDTPTPEEDRAESRRIALEAAYRSQQNKALRTIHIRTPMELGLYGELLTLITTRWPDATLTRDGIYIPPQEEQ